MRDVLDQVRKLIDDTTFNLDSEMKAVSKEMTETYHEAVSEQDWKLAFLLLYHAMIDQPHQWNNPNYPVQAMDWLARAEELLRGQYA